MRWLAILSALGCGCTFGGGRVGGNAASVGDTSGTQPVDTDPDPGDDDGGDDGQATTSGPAGTTTAATTTGGGSTGPGKPTDTTASLDDTGPGSTSGSTAAAESSTGTPQDTLIEDGLLVRYYLDEDFAGRPAGVSVTDSAPGAPNSDLPLEFENMQPDFFGAPAGHAGMRWSQVDNSGRPQKLATQTKVAELDATSIATIQVVAAATGAHPSGSRFFSVGQGDPSGNGHFDVAFDNLGDLEMRIEPEVVLARWAPTITPEPQVYTVLVDLAASPPARLFVDTTEVLDGQLDPFAPAQLAFQADDVFALGNRSDGNRSFVGDLLYVAIYDRVLTDAEVEHNVGVLLDNDDTP